MKARPFVNCSLLLQQLAPRLLNNVLSKKAETTRRVELAKEFIHGV